MRQTDFADNLATVGHTRPIIGTRNVLGQRSHRGSSLREVAMELAPSAHMVCLDRASHFAHVDRPEAVTTQLIDFLTAPDGH